MDVNRISHYPRCFGCGEANQSGLRLEARMEGDELVGSHTPPADSEGGPGIVHGGYIAAVVDEYLSLLASVRSEVPAMTRRVELDFKLPALTEHPLEIRVRVEEETDRKIVARLEGRAMGNEHASFLAKGILVKVQVKEWSKQMATQGVDVTQIDFDTGDPSNYHRWVLESMKAAFVLDRVRARTTVALALEDVTPRLWRITVDKGGLLIEEGTEGDADVRLEGSFRSWLELLTKKEDISQMASEGRLKVTGDHQNFARFRSVFNFAPLNRPPSFRDEGGR